MFSHLPAICFLACSSTSWLRLDDFQSKTRLRAKQQSSHSASPQLRKSSEMNTSMLQPMPLMSASAFESLFHSTIRLRGGDGIPWLQQEAKLLHFEADPQLNEILIVKGLNISGLRICFEAIMFVRQEVVDMWSFLNTCPNYSMVSGPPGCGKSTLAWTWFCRSCLVNPGVSGLWIHAVDTEPFLLVLVRDGQVTRCNGVVGSEAFQFICTSPLDIVVLDGYQPTFQIHEDLRYQVRAFQLREQESFKFLLVTPLAASMDPEKVSMYNYGFFVLNGWTLQQYKAACLNKTFFESVRTYLEPEHSGEAVQRQEYCEDYINDLVESKYYFAGSSVRWMFSIFEGQVIKAVNYHLERLDDIDMLLNAKRGSTCMLSRCYNHLILQHPKGGFFVSQHVSRKVLERCSKATILTAYHLASLHNNFAFLGWVAEFDFVAQLQIASGSLPENRKIMVQDESGAALYWEVPGITEFDSGNLADALSMNGHWLKPSLWNQAGFDLMRLQSTKDGFLVLDLIQVTSGGSHDMNLRHFHRMAKEVERLLQQKGGSYSQGGTMQDEMPSRKLHGVQIFVVTPLNDGVFRKPKLNLTSSGMLSEYYIGSSQTKWTEGSELSHIPYFAFVPVGNLQGKKSVRKSAPGNVVRKNRKANVSACSNQTLAKRPLTAGSQRGGRGGMRKKRGG